MSYDRLSAGLDGQRRTGFLSHVLQPHSNDAAVSQEASTCLVTALTENIETKRYDSTLSPSPVMQLK